jgi:hypothetical protein
MCRFLMLFRLIRESGKREEADEVKEEKGTARALLDGS